MAYTRENVRGDLGTKYGKYCAVGETQACRYFDVTLALDAEPIIREMSFFTKDTKVDTLGQMFQGINAVRPLTVEEESKLMELSRKCPPLLI